MREGAERSGETTENIVPYSVFALYGVIGSGLLTAFNEVVCPIFELAAKCEATDAAFGIVRGADVSS